MNPINIAPEVILFIAFVMGLVFGSFSTMASFRIPRKEDLIFKPSRCPNCGFRLKVRDLIPVLSWLMNHGSCRKCKTKISVRYPIIEIITGVLFLLSVYISDFKSYCIFLCFGSVVLVVLVTICFETRKKP